jgi:hypothetical protein
LAAVTVAVCSSRDRFDPRKDAFVEAVVVLGAQLQRRLTDNRVHDPAGGAGDAALGDGRGQHQRDGDRDTHPGERLLRAMDPQAAAVDVQQRERAEQPRASASPGHHRGAQLPAVGEPAREPSV